MKFAKHLISGAAAIAVAGTLGLAFAQTNTPATTAPSAQAAPQAADRAPGTQQPLMQQGTTGTTGTTNSGTMTQQGTTGTTNSGTMNSGTAGATTTNSGTMNSGSNATLSNDSTTGNRNTTGMSNNRRMNADGTMSTELAARADRG